MNANFAIASRIHSLILVNYPDKKTLLKNPIKYGYEIKIEKPNRTLRRFRNIGKIPG